MGSICEQLLLGVLLVIPLSYKQSPNSSTSTSLLQQNRPLTLKLDPYSVRNGLDTLRPQSLVEFGINPDVFCAHRFLGEVHYGLDGPRSTLLK